MDRRPFEFSRAHQIAARDEAEESTDVSQGNFRHLTYTILNEQYTEITREN